MQAFIAPKCFKRQKKIVNRFEKKLILVGRGVALGGDRPTFPGGAKCLSQLRIGSDKDRTHVSRVSASSVVGQRPIHSKIANEKIEPQMGVYEERGTMHWVRHYYFFQVFLFLKTFSFSFFLTVFVHFLFSKCYTQRISFL